MHVLDELQSRGFIKDVTDPEGLRARMDEGPITFYCGFDPTNTSLTAGNLVAVMLMAHLQRAGHRPIVILGGGTAKHVQEARPGHARVRRRNRHDTMKREGDGEWRCDHPTAQGTRTADRRVVDD